MTIVNRWNDFTQAIRPIGWHIGVDEKSCFVFCDLGNNLFDLVAHVQLIYLYVGTSHCKELI